MRLYALAIALLLAAGCGGGSDHDDGPPQVAERLWIAAGDASTSPPPTATLLRSDDHGATWHTAYTTDYHLRALGFSDREHGTAVGDGAVVHTADGGAHWLTARAVPGEDLYGLAFADAEHGLAVGATVADDNTVATAILLETTNGGADWHTVTLPPQHEGDFDQVFDVCFVSADTALIVGSRNFGQALAYQGNASGWTDVSDRFPQSLYRVDCHADGEIWIVPLGGALLHSSDGGLTSSNVTVSNVAFATDVAFSDATHGWLVGAISIQVTPHSTLAVPVLLRTTDGGRSWTQSFMGPGYGGWHTLTLDRDSSAFAGGEIFPSPTTLAVRADDDGVRPLTLPPGLGAVRAATFVVRR